MGRDGDTLWRSPPSSPFPSHQEFPFHPQDNIHAEICFLYWFHDKVLKVLSPREEFKITWYMSWSPCFECAEQIVRFLATHHNLSLDIFSSRLYNVQDPETQQNLCRLVQEGAQVAAMDLYGEEWAPVLQEGMWVCHTVKGVCPGNQP